MGPDRSSQKSFLSKLEHGKPIFVEAARAWIHGIPIKSYSWQEQLAAPNFTVKQSPLGSWTWNSRSDISRTAKAVDKLKFSSTSFRTFGVKVPISLFALARRIANQLITVVLIYSNIVIKGYSLAYLRTAFQDSAMFESIMLYLCPLKWALVQCSKPALYRQNKMLN